MAYRDLFFDIKRPVVVVESEYEIKETQKNKLLTGSGSGAGHTNPRRSARERRVLLCVWLNQQNQNQYLLNLLKSS